MSALASPVRGMVPDFDHMGIYIDGRTQNELRELLKTKEAAEVTARDLHRMSCMHYLDDKPMENAAALFGLKREGSTSDDRVPVNILDFGAGFAGDARLMSTEFSNCKVTCLEVQPHIHKAAEHLTGMIGASDKCTHICADIFDDKPLQGAPFDHMFSILVILHIPERDHLWKNLAAALKTGATIYVEDYFAAKPLSEKDKSQLAAHVACPYLPSKEEYLNTLKNAGFGEIEWEVVNNEWAPFVDERIAAFRNNKDRNLQVHGEKLTSELDLFYSTVQQLFARGNLGGVRLKARKVK